jgi:hypothetical protein
MESAFVSDAFKVLEKWWALPIFKSFDAISEGVDGGGMQRDVVVGNSGGRDEAIWTNRGCNSSRKQTLEQSV